MQALLQQAGFWTFVNAAFPRNVSQKIAQITLHQVVVGGEIQQLVAKLKLIQKNPSFNLLLNAPLTERKVTPLHLCAMLGQQKMAELLLEKGASLKTADSQGYTPLHMAAATGNGDLLAVFLSAADKQDPTIRSMRNIICHSRTDSRLLKCSKI